MPVAVAAEGHEAGKAMSVGPGIKREKGIFFGREGGETAGR